MNPELGWTKEMIDEIKDCEFNNRLPIIIKVQNNNYEFKDKERDEEYKFASNLPISYKGIISSSHCLEEEWGSRVPDYDSEKYKPWGEIDIFIQFYDNKTRIFEELSIEPYKYGYLTFLNSKINGDVMPTISMFYGIIIRMYCSPREHNPPHIHAYYQDCKAVIDIRACEIPEGKLPPKQTKLALAWAEIHKEELLADWELASKGELPFPIEPLK